MLPLDGTERQGFDKSNNGLIHHRKVIDPYTNFRYHKY